MRHLEQEAAFLRSRTLPSRLVLTLYRLSQVHYRIGDVRAAFEALDEAEAVSRVAELPYERALSDVGRAAVMLEVGDQEASSDLLPRARAALVLTADADGLTRAMDVLGRSGDLSLTAKLLLHGGRMGGDAEVLRSAEAEARKSRDRFVLLSVLHAVGGDDARREGYALVGWIEAHLPKELRGAFLRNPAVRWAQRQVEASVSVG